MLKTIIMVVDIIQLKTCSSIIIVHIFSKNSIYYFQIHLTIQSDHILLDEKKILTLNFTTRAWPASSTSRIKREHMQEYGSRPALCSFRTAASTTTSKMRKRETLLVWAPQGLYVEHVVYIGFGGTSILGFIITLAKHGQTGLRCWGT